MKAPKSIDPGITLIDNDLRREERPDDELAIWEA
jgi:hypothetical protein